MNSTQLLCFVVAGAALFGADVREARGASLLITTNCTAHGRSCVTVVGPADGGLGKTIHVQPLLDDGAEARDDAWVAYCQPSIVEDRYGVPRYTYAHAGCEFGRTRD